MQIIYIIYLYFILLQLDLCPDCEDKISPYPDIEFTLSYALPKRDDPPPPPTSGAPPSLDDYFVLPYFTQLEKFDNVTSTRVSACIIIVGDQGTRHTGVLTICVNLSLLCSALLKLTRPMANVDRFGIRKLVQNGERTGNNKLDEK